jgi:hypothetical protein
VFSLFVLSPSGEPQGALEPLEFAGRARQQFAENIQLAGNAGALHGLRKSAKTARRNGRGRSSQGVRLQGDAWPIRLIEPLP